MTDLNRSPLQGLRFWRELDARIQRQVRRRAAPVRAVLSNVSAAAKGLLTTLEARAGETVDQVEIAQHFGFRSVAPAGLEAVAIPIGGSSAHLVVVGEIDRSTTPPTLVVGEAALYSTGGAKVVAKADGSVVINDGAAGVARVGDDTQTPLTSDDIVAIAAQMVAAQLVAPPVSTPPGVPPGYTLGGSVSSGSSTVKAG